MFKHFTLLIAGIVLFVLCFTYLIGLAQISNPATVEFPTASFTVTDGNISGTALDWSGWNLAKKSSFNKPIRVSVLIEAVSDTLATYYYTVRYFGTSYSQRHYGTTFTPFWLPDSAAQYESDVPDSLFRIAPDSTGMAAGDLFYINSNRIRPGGQYVSRLIYPTDWARGTITVTSQPVWIGDGVSSMVFGYQASHTGALVYRTLYATSHDGFYTGITSSDTLADSTYIADSTSIGAWSYKTITAANIDDMSWMRVERIGKTAADTTKITGQILIIQSE